MALPYKEEKLGNWQNVSELVDFKLNYKKNLKKPGQILIMKNQAHRHHHY